MPGILSNIYRKNVLQLLETDFLKYNNKIATETSPMILLEVLSARHAHLKCNFVSFSEYDRIISLYMMRSEQIH